MQQSLHIAYLILQVMSMQNSRQKILLLPSQKIGTDAFLKVCDADKFDLLITDWECVEEELMKLSEKGVDVIETEPADCVKPAEDTTPGTDPQQETPGL